MFLRIVGEYGPLFLGCARHDVLSKISSVSWRVKNYVTEILTYKCLLAERKCPNQPSRVIFPV